MAASVALPLAINATTSQQSTHTIGLRNRYRLDESKQSKYRPQSSIKGPDIEYTPDLAKYHIRASARLRHEKLESEVPAGWPTHIDSRKVWTGADFPTEETFVHHLSIEEKADIDTALFYFNRLGLNGDEVTRETFPLPVLSLFLQEAWQELVHGKGFFILRGIDPEDYSPEDITVIFLGVSSYISEKRGKQDSHGRMLRHIVDCAVACNHPGMEPTRHSQIAQPFHNDMVCDVIALLVRNCAAKGGKSLLASSATVYNELARARPDLIHVLAKDDWPWDNFGRDPAYLRRALLHQNGSNVIFSFARPRLTGHYATPRTPGIPVLSEAQAEALDAVHFIAQSHQLITSMEPGDMRFVNNVALLHGREKFQNEGESERHLVRLWLQFETNENSLPPLLKPLWEGVFEDLERGEIWEIDAPEIDWKIIRHSISHGD